MQPPPLVWTQYQKFFEASVEAFQASETEVGVVAVIRRPDGVVGAVRSFGAALTFAITPSASRAARRTEVRRDIAAPSGWVGTPGDTPRSPIRIRLACNRSVR